MTYEVMKKTLIILLMMFAGFSAQTQTLSVYKSELSVDKTTELLEKVIKDSGLIFFETVAHDKIAAERGVEMNEIREVLFENADLTTSLIQCQPTTALDLPLKILVWEENEDVYIGFIDVKFMKKRFMLSGCEEIVDDMGKLMVRVVIDTLRATRSQD